MQPDLSHVEVVHTLDDADKVCTACGGALGAWEGRFEESKEIDVIERRFVIKKHKPQKYVCKCGACVETALGSEKLFAGARYSIDFAVEVAVEKYLDHAPLERQVRTMRREGLVVESQTLWDQLERLARPLTERGVAAPRVRAFAGAPRSPLSSTRCSKAPSSRASGPKAYLRGAIGAALRGEPVALPHEIAARYARA